MNSKRWVKAANILGGIVSLVLVGFVLFKGLRSLGTSEIDWLSARLWILLVFSQIIVLAATLLLPVNYAYILSRLHEVGHPAGSKYSGIVYGQTQILKYLPGNVFHFVGRQLRLGQVGVPQLVTGNTSVIEMLSLLFVAASIAALTGSKLLPEVIDRIGMSSSGLMFLGLSALAVVAAFTWILFYFNKKRIRFSGASLLVALAVHAGFFVLSGLGFWLVVDATGPGTISAFTAVTIFSIAWLLGTVMPGASAGIGVREAVILVLGQLVAGVDLAIAAIVLRLITVVADLLMWMTSAILAGSPVFDRD